MRRVSIAASTLAALVALAMGLVGCQSGELVAIGTGVAISPVAVPLVEATRPVVGPLAAATTPCTPSSRSPVFSAGGDQVAILSECLRGEGLDIRVGPVRHGAGLTRHPVRHYEVELGEFTSPTTITWLTTDAATAEGLRGKWTNTLSVYERDLTTDRDRLVAALTAPFVIQAVHYRQGDGCAVIEAQGRGAGPVSKNYVLRDGKLTPLALPDGVSWPVYWDSVQKAFVLRVGEPIGPNRTPVSFAKAGCDAKVEALPNAFAAEESPLREIYQAVSAPGAPVVLIGFLGGGGQIPPSHLARLDLAAAARLGSAAVESVPQTWPASRPPLFNPLLSSRGKYFGVDFSDAFYALRASDDRAVFSHVRGRAMEQSRSAFTPDETRYVLVGGDRVEVYPIEGAAR